VPEETRKKERRREEGERGPFLLVRVSSLLRPARRLKTGSRGERKNRGQLGNVFHRDGQNICEKYGKLLLFNQGDPLNNLL